VQAAAVAGEAAVRADDAVARDDDRHGRPPHRGAHGADDVGAAEPLGELRVRDRGAEGDLAQVRPDPLLEGRAAEVEGEVERPLLAGEVRLELRDGGRQRSGVVVALIQRPAAPREPQPGQAALARQDGQRSERALVHGPGGRPAPGFGVRAGGLGGGHGHETPDGPAT
jgi:hypothetical protein